jgi:hypothetical protein
MESAINSAAATANFEFEVLKRARNNEAPWWLNVVPASGR